jgi:hypothetical protein
MNAEEVKAKFLSDLKEKGRIQTIGGVFGEIRGCDGYVEEVIKPEEGGTFVKIYGCSFLYKGLPHHAQVHGLELSKSLISEIPREIIGRSYVLLIAFGLLFLFARKRLIHFADHLFDVLIRRAVRWYDLPPKEYNAFAKELTRATTNALQEVFGLTELEIHRAQHVYEPDSRLEHLNASDVKFHPKQLGYLLARVSKFVILVLELDSAYRFRAQDVIGAGTFMDCLDLLASRETAHGIAFKWDFLKRVLKLAFWFMPDLERFVNATMANIDQDKVRMDESDWYFCLRWLSYDFGGLNQEERFALRDRIDAENGHVFLV